MLQCERPRGQNRRRNEAEEKSSVLQYTDQMLQCKMRRRRRAPYSNTLIKLFEGRIESRLAPFTELHNTLTSAQQGSRPGRQTHDAIYALFAGIQQRKQVSDMPTYCCFIDFSSAYLSVHREILALLLQKYGIAGKILNLAAQRHDCR